MSLETSKLLGEIGALLVVVSPIAGSLSTALSLIGLVLLLVVFNNLADYYADRSIFKNVLYGIIMFAVGAVIAAIIVGIAAAGALAALGIPMSGITSPSAFQGINFNNLNMNALAPYVAAIVVALIIFFVLAVLAAYYIRKSFATLAQKTGEHMFATSGLVLLIGAILTIILIGFILIWVAMLLLAIAFFRLRIEGPARQTSAVTQ